MHCVLHIGLHKTGSTSVQLTLSRAREHLDKIGLLYPAKPQQDYSKFVSHHGLAAQISGYDPGGIPAEYMGPTLSELTKQIDARRPEYLILSSETFSTPFEGRAEDSQLIRALLRRETSIAVVVMIRPQTEMIEASYVEGVMSFYNYVPFGEYLRAAITEPFFDYRKRLQAWIGSYKMKFVPLPYGFGVPRNRLTHAILEAGGIPRSITRTLPDTCQVNQNPGAMTIAAMRALVPHMWRLQNDPVRDDLKAFVLAEAEARGWISDRFSGYLPSDMGMVEDRFARLNDEFAKELWNRRWEDVFPSNGETRRRNEIDLTTAPPELLEEFGDFRRKVEDYLATIRQGRG
jgi:hypothetical protein